MVSVVTETTSSTLVPRLLSGLRIDQHGVPTGSKVDARKRRFALTSIDGKASVQTDDVVLPLKGGDFAGVYLPGRASANARGLTRRFVGGVGRKVVRKL